MPLFFGALFISSQRTVIWKRFRDLGRPNKASENIRTALRGDWHRCLRGDDVQAERSRVGTIVVESPTSLRLGLFAPIRRNTESHNAAAIVDGLKVVLHGYPKRRTVELTWRSESMHSSPQQARCKIRS